MHKSFFLIGFSFCLMPLAQAAEAPGLPAISPPVVAAPALTTGGKPPPSPAPLPGIPNLAPTPDALAKQTETTKAPNPTEAGAKTVDTAAQKNTPGASAEKKITKTTPELAYKSLMFLPLEMASIAKVEAEYILIKSGKAPAVAATPETKEAVKPVEQTYFFPQFYLSSVVYRNDSDWVVWINSEKYAPSSSKSGDTLFVKSVTPKEVIIEWRPDLTEKISLNLPNRPGVIIDKDNRIIDFTLHPNQTFLSYNMKIVEGKRAPVQAPPGEEQGLIEALTGEVGSAVKAVGTPDPQPKVQTKEGLPGLLNAYQNIDKK